MRRTGLRHRWAAGLAAFLFLLGRADAGRELGHWEPVAGEATLAARLGSGWEVFRDPATGSPSMLAGPGLPVGGPIRADDEGIARARSLLEAWADVLGVEDPSAFVLERAAATPNPNGQELVYINFKQTWRGLDVWHQAAGGESERLAMVKFQFNGTLGRIVLLGSDAVRGLAVPEEVRLREADAAAAALRGGLPVAVAAVEGVEARSYVSVRGRDRFLAREVRVRTQGPRHEYRFIFDSASGERVELLDDLRSADVVGNVSTGGWDYPGGTFAARPARDLRVDVATGPFGFTNAAGDFSIPVGSPSAVAITGRLAGRWAVVDDLSGNGNISFNLMATPGTPANVVLNPLPLSEFQTAEASGYHWTTYLRNFVRGSVPSFNGLENLSVQVNGEESCNAYFLSSGGILFLRADDRCNNTAYLDIIAHEYGHAFHDWFHGSLNPGAFSEGIGDHLSMFVTGDRRFGRNFRKNGNAARDYRLGGPGNLRTWPCVGCEVHAAGQIWAGFCMDVRDSLVASLGPVFGVIRAQTITIAPYASNPSDMPEAVMGVLVQDDDDANLANGTPRCAEIVAAARRHNLPVPHLIPVSCGAEPPPPVPEFRAPVFEAGIGGGLRNWSPTLDGAGLTIWWVSDRAGGQGGLDLWTASRPSVSAPWGAAANVAGLNSAADEESVAVSADGLTLAFASNRSGGVGGLDLYLSTRAERNDPWGPAVAYVHRTADDEHQPSLTADGLELFFARAGSGDKDVWVSTRRLPTDPWSAPSPVTDVNTALDDGSPAVSADGTRLFVSRRMLGAASADWWTYRRGGAGQPWGLFRRVAEISSDTATEFTGHDDGDGFSFYFARTTGMFSTGIWRADRVHPRLRVPPVYLPVLNFPEPPPPTNVTLRRDPGNVGLIALGIDPLPPTAIPGIEGLLLTIPLLTVANAVHDANGIVLWTIPRLPPGVAPGLIAHFQGVSQDAGGQYFLSNRVLFRLEL